MGSEDVEVHCQTQSASASVPCESAASYGIATVPFVASVSVAPNRSRTGTPVSAGTVMLAQSAASHTPPQNVAVQPSVAASPLPHVQVIQQPLQNQYLQHLYAPQQQHMFLPGNLTLQPTIQSIGATPAGISLQLQGKSMENKAATPTIISAAPMQTVGNFGAQNIIPAGNQMAAAAKACVPGQMLAASSKSTVIQGQSGFIPVTTSNQTVVIGQLGVLSNPQTVLPHQAKAITDSQKGKSYLISQPATLHPKSPILPSPNVSCAGQMIATSQLKQIPAASHILTTQAPTMITNQAQLLGNSYTPTLLILAC
ncbi:hypothetical protein AVEN_3940-1 [Araneus ventricosus]|uniref:Uncharacterized protein n=1 Tax=Araneus ventricosus TaxID=182803 RepID=A0A4Y2JYJ8_ARAVE|nr:hypothetical protein AVEN_3940-1 [Araneus ventricosus]